MNNLFFFVNSINGDNMNENLEMLEYIYKSASMGVESLTNLLKELDNKENKLKGIISDELSCYEKYSKQSKKLLKKNNGKVEGNSLMTKIMSKQGIKMEVKKDNSDASVAHLLIQGLTMGVVDIESKIKNLDEKTDKDILKIGKDFLKFQQDEIEKLKSFL